MIRPYQLSDFDAVKRLHVKSGLPTACLPPVNNPNVVIQLVVEELGQIVQYGAVKLTSEAFVLLDHEHSSPQERWQRLGDLAAMVLRGAAEKGLDDCSVWVPPSVEASFGKRLEALGAIRSPWPNYTFFLR
jgi:hypothetical protein